MVALYAFVAKRRYGVKLDFVQVVIYKVKTDGMPLKERVLERVLALLKFLGLVMIVTGPFLVFH